MKILLIALSLLAMPAFAAHDSLMFIVRKEKALVQINEPGSASRLQTLLASLSTEHSVLLMNADQSIKLDCERGERAATCVIRILPGAQTKLEPATAQAFVKLAELGIPGDRLVADQAHEFQSSNGDRFTIRVRAGQLELEGQKL
jgi:hypothetical protein